MVTEIKSYNDRPLPVTLTDMNGVTMSTRQVSLDMVTLLSAKGRVYYSSDADQNDTVTGQTSFADTTPTFMIDVPAGIVCLPLAVKLSQTGSVAGGAIDVLFEFDNIKRYASSGTAEKMLSPRKSMNRKPQCKVYTGATAAAGYGISLDRFTIGQDVSTAEGAVNVINWRAEAPIPLEGPASFLVYTYAGTTGPTWYWAASFGELTVAEYASMMAADF